MGLGNVLARTLRQSVDALNGMRPHANNSESRINASSGNALNELSAPACFMVAFLDLRWKSQLKPINNEARTTFIFTFA
jgi:hypothetical protein